MKIEPVIMKDLGVTLDFDEVCKKLHINEDLIDDFRDIFDECARVANPKFMYAQCPISQDGEITHVGPSDFNSRIMNVNFKDVKVAWAYIVTCGHELYELALTKDDPLERFWADEISEQYLHRASAMNFNTIKKLSGADELYSMNPGSLADFPISNQRELFDIFGDTKAMLGVWLKETFLILPYKSCSGIYFQSDERFVNCSCCPREGCPNRRAPYDEMQMATRYSIQNGCASGTHAC